MWIKAKRLTNATAAYGLLGFVFERLLGFAHQASSLSPESKVRCIMSARATEYGF